MLSGIQHPIYNFLNLLKAYQIHYADEMARELLRVHLTKTKLDENEKTIDADIVYFTMQTLQLDLFPGDAEMFKACFEAGHKLDFYETLLEIYRTDHTGVVVVPEQVTEVFSERVNTLQPNRVLIPEAHKFLRGLLELVFQAPCCEFVLLVENFLYQQILDFLFRKTSHVQVQMASLYYTLELEPFDFILCLPTFGRKSYVESDRFITRESDGIAVENLLELLVDDGELMIILPARFTFSGGAFAKLRKMISQYFVVSGIYLLPSGTLRPLTMIKTYVFQFRRLPVEEVKLGEFRSVHGQFSAIELATLPIDQFASREDWRMEVILAEYQQSKLQFSPQWKTVRLSEIAHLFRGKSILKSHLQPTGNIRVLNISNIENGEILWDQWDQIQEDEAKIKRYLLQQNDLVFTCRGTVIKIAVVERKPHLVIASANVIVVRFAEEEQLWSSYIKIFLETPLGRQMLQSFQRGTAIMNINPKDVGEMEIPVLDKSAMEQLVQTYQQEYQTYRATILRAQTRWEEQKQRIYQFWK